jgi:sulfite exporter TauE/SafE
MKTLNNEKVVSEVLPLKLTNFKIVRERTGVWRYGIEEIPLTKVDSIYYYHRRRLGAFVFGVIFLAVGIFIQVTPSLYKFLFVVYGGLVLIIFGILSIALGLMKKEGLEVRAGTTRFSEEREGLEDFTQKLRDAVYNK